MGEQALRVNSAFRSLTLDIAARRKGQAVAALFGGRSPTVEVLIAVRSLTVAALLVGTDAGVVIGKG